MGTQPGYWAVLPSPVRYDRTLTATAKLLYAEISGLMQIDGYCWATDRYFAELFGVSEATISRALRTLRDAGYIRIDRTTNAKGTERHIYAGLMPGGGGPVKNEGTLRGTVKNDETPPGGPVKNEGTPPSEDAELELNQGNSTGYDSRSIDDPGNKEELFNPPKKQEKKPPESVPRWKPERFAAFYAYYPLHKGRQAAVHAWDKLRPDDVLIARMGRALRQQMQSDEWQRGIGIPHPSTWLNQQRWEDEVELKLRPPDRAAAEATDVEYWTPEMSL